MKQKLTFLLVALFVLVLSACNSDSQSATEGSNNDSAENAETITINHKLGNTDVKVNPEKVISFDFGILDTLDTLGIDVVGVPKEGTVPGYLEKYAGEEYESVGSLKEPDFEKINELQPELIIISARQAELYEEFQEIAPTIYLGIDETKYMESFKENTKVIGQIFDKETEVEEELAKVEENIQALNDKATKLDKNALVVLANEGTVSAYGPSSRFGIIHDVFGVKPVDEKIEVSTHGMSVDFDYIFKQNPDYLFVIDRGAVVTTGGGGSSAKEVIENDIIKETKAYKEGNIVYLDPNYWYISGGGLVSVSEMVREIDAAIQ
ncbi:siderophore ABC transporter substrate-binding protein [Niallia sp. Krafla_26]|uniref:siderophore ABC transporter substrate-binding protein n=1 Tax=Niallia sp. Krafla_26 TaxID=3064703 RepID=UPI003D169222